MKLRISADFLKGRITFGELDGLPNRYSHTIYYLNYLHELDLKKHPQQAKDEAMADALQGMITGG
jgi:hypothetical protein